MRISTSREFKIADLNGKEIITSIKISPNGNIEMSVEKSGVATISYELVLEDIRDMISFLTFVCENHFPDEWRELISPREIEI
jgi:hypothetical protein